MRGIRPIERQAEEAMETAEDDEEAEIVRGYCAALTDDGRPPSAASGLKLHQRLSTIASSLDRVAAPAGELPGGLERLRQLLRLSG